MDDEINATAEVHYVYISIFLLLYLISFLSSFKMRSSIDHDFLNSLIIYGVIIQPRDANFVTCF